MANREVKVTINTDWGQWNVYVKKNNVKHHIISYGNKWQAIEEAEKQARYHLGDATLYFFE